MFGEDKYTELWRQQIVCIRKCSINLDKIVKKFQKMVISVNVRWNCNFEFVCLKKRESSNKLIILGMNKLITFRIFQVRMTRARATVLSVTIPPQRRPQRTTITQNVATSRRTSPATGSAPSVRTPWFACGTLRRTSWSSLQRRTPRSTCPLRRRLVTARRQNRANKIITTRRPTTFPIQTPWRAKTRESLTAARRVPSASARTLTRRRQASAARWRNVWPR